MTNHPIVPVNVSGKATDLSHTATFDTPAGAAKCFDRAHKRLLNPAIWGEICGPASASFSLTSHAGGDVRRLAKEGDYFTIDIPGPGNATGGGYDWVIVDAIDEPDSKGDTGVVAIRLKAAAAPDTDAKAAAHFFRDGASSSFVVERQGNTVTASYHGRNELPNTETGNIANSIRNALVAAGGLAGLSELQWSALLKGLLEPEIGG